MLTYQCESLKDCLDEVKALWLSHWQETEGYRAGLPFNPDYARYLEYNDIGYYLLFTARDGKKMVGDIGMYVTVSMHTQTRIAQEDTLYLLPEARQGMNAWRFIDFTEKYLVSVGVREINLTTKLTNPKAAKLMQKMGYPITANVHTKIIEA